VEVCFGVYGVVLSALLGGSEQMSDHATKCFETRGDTCGQKAGFIFFHRRWDGVLDVLARIIRLIARSAILASGREISQDVF